MNSPTSSEVPHISCPHCHHLLDAATIARQLPASVLVSEKRARRVTLRRRQARPGRPRGVAYCPSCPNVFTPETLKDHLLQCLTSKLAAMRTAATHVEVRPMDPTEWREFTVSEVRDEVVMLNKLSNSQYVEVPLRSIREITPAVNGGLVVLVLRGALRWKEDVQRWRFSAD